MIDDGSTDRTLELLRAERALHPELRVIRFLKNCGQSAAMAAGFAAARGEVAVTLDADLQDEPADIAKLLQRLEAGGCEAVCGWREKRHDNWLRRVSSRIANGVRNWVSGDDIIDTGCTLKVYKTEYLKRIRMFKGGHRFLPTLLKMEGARIEQLPVRHNPRLAGRSKYGVWNRLFKSSADLLAVRWMKSRQIRYQAEEVQ
jgi:glycosyltransferase involved in cell wall biosynthesis